MKHASVYGSNLHQAHSKARTVKKIAVAATLAISAALGLFANFTPVTFIAYVLGATAALALTLNACESYLTIARRRHENYLSEKSWQSITTAVMNDQLTPRA